MTTGTGLASATWAAAFRDMHTECDEVSRSLKQLMQNDEMLGAAANALRSSVGEITAGLDAIAAKSEAIAPVMDQQAEFDRVYMQHPPVDAELVKVFESSGC